MRDEERRDGSCDREIFPRRIPWEDSLNLRVVARPRGCTRALHPEELLCRFAEASLQAVAKRLPATRRFYAHNIPPVLGPTHSVRQFRIRYRRLQAVLALKPQAIEQQVPARKHEGAEASRSFLSRVSAPIDACPFRHLGPCIRQASGARFLRHHREKAQRACGRGRAKSVKFRNSGAHHRSVRGPRKWSGKARRGFPCGVLK